VSFLTIPLSLSGIDDTNHPLGPGVYVHMPDLHRLAMLVAPPITVKGLDHLTLKPKKLDCIVAVNVDDSSVMCRWLCRRNRNPEKPAAIICFLPRRSFVSSHRLVKGAIEIGVANRQVVRFAV
jgi:hypothetical protein